MIFGPDVSDYQGTVDWAQVKREGFSFALAKCTEGSTWRGRTYARNRDGVRAVGMAFAAYHYVTTDSPTSQAANCAAWIGDKSIPVMLDVETNSGGIGNVRAVLAAFQANGLHVPVIYLPRWYWQQIGSPSMSGLPPLVSSRYPSTTPGYASVLYQKVPSTYWSGYGGSPVALLQFADSALIAGQRMDANAFPGTLAQLTQLFHGTTQEVDVTPEQDTMIRELHAQLCNKWPSWVDGKSSWTLVDFARWIDKNLAGTRLSHVKGSTVKFSALDAAMNADAYGYEAQQAIADLKAKLDALAAPAAVDAAALAAALAPALAEHLPTITDADVAKIAAAAAAELARRLAA
ncbi:MAG: glycoside hydrolase family 25 protein [Pseudonocardiaceae bacterium]